MAEFTALLEAASITHRVPKGGGGKGPQLRSDHSNFAGAGMKNGAQRRLYYRKMKEIQLRDC